MTSEFDQEIAAVQNEIKSARASLAVNLRTLASTNVLQDVKGDISDEMTNAKERLSAVAKDRVREAGESYLSALKDKVSSNPLPFLAIAAGIGWRFWKRPPVATALVSAGLYGLLNEEASKYLSERTDQVKNATQELVAARGAVSIPNGLEREANGVAAEGLSLQTLAPSRDQALVAAATVAVGAALAVSLKRRKSIA